MVSGIERKRCSKLSKWHEPRNKPDWGVPRRHRHPRRSRFADQPELANLFLWQDLARTAQIRLTLQKGSARRAKTAFPALEDALRTLRKHKEQERVMTRLEDAVEVDNELAFLESLKDVEWWSRPPGAFMHAIQLALTVGAHSAARQISAEGVKWHPQHPEISKYARILAPPRVVSKDMPIDPSRRAN